jgi:predicted membrane-bound spermidine synthase
MRLFAYLPLAFYPGAKDVLLICYGCGVTADAFTRKSSLERIDIVDIAKEVFSLADFYSGINYSSPLRDPRVHAIVQDGRFFLQASPRKYDIISGEPPPPKVAGAVNLYTEERRNCDLLVTDLSAEGGGNKGDSARIPQRVSKRFGVGQCRSGLDHDGNQWPGPRSE